MLVLLGMARTISAGAEDVPEAEPTVFDGVYYGLSDDTRHHNAGLGSSSAMHQGRARIDGVNRSPSPGQSCTSQRTTGPLHWERRWRIGG